jgi:hypothetical protein
LTSRVRTVPALRVTSAMGVLFTTGIQIVMVVLFPNGGSTTLSTTSIKLRAEMNTHSVEIKSSQ